MTRKKGKKSTTLRAPHIPRGCLKVLVIEVGGIEGKTNAAAPQRWDLYRIDRIVSDPIQWANFKLCWSLSAKRERKADFRLGWCVPEQRLAGNNDETALLNYHPLVHAQLLRYLKTHLPAAIQRS